MATVQGGRRAHNLAEMADIEARVLDMGDMVRSITSFQPRPTDVIISPAGKCGTTLLQQTFHTLRTHGDMDFDDISRVVPWIETSGTLGIDINAEQRSEPRGFKSHLGWEQVPKGAKYVVSLRDPKDAFVSEYRFMEGWFFEPGAISYAEMFAERKEELGKGRDHWSHLAGWWEQRDNPEVLLLSYEHMVDNPELNARRVAEFCGVPLNDELLALTIEHTSREFMLRYKDRFDDAMLRELSETKGGLPPGSDSAKVRAGGAEKRRLELPRAISQEFDDIWLRDVTSRIGFADFEALEVELRSLANR